MAIPGGMLSARHSLDQESGDVCFIHVMFAYLNGHDREDADWKYVGSKVNVGDRKPADRNLCYNRCGNI